MWSRVSGLEVVKVLIEDCLVAVVIDRKNDPKADTGGFELIYKQNIPPSPAYMGLNLFLKGQQITQKTSGGGGVRKEKLSNKDENNNRNNLKQFVSRNVSSSAAVGAAGNGSEKLRKGPVIMDLIDCLDVKNTRRPLASCRTANGQAGRRNSSQVFLKSKNKVDVEYKEKNNSSSRRHHSCGPVVLRQNTISSVPLSVPIQKEESGPDEEPFIMPATVLQGDSNSLTFLGKRVDQKEETVSLPLITSFRKSSSETTGKTLKTSPKENRK